MPARPEINKYLLCITPAIAAPELTLKKPIILKHQANWPILSQIEPASNLGRSLQHLSLKGASNNLNWKNELLGLSTQYINFNLSHVCYQKRP